MKLKSSIILVLAALWGTGSWWWYTCKIKGFCSIESGASSTASVATAAKALPPTEDDNQDNDKDGVRNGDEKRLGTDLNNPDTDEDGVSDLVEISQIPNDTDSDGLIDALDDDDDNDTILTKDESPDQNNDGRIDDALDSDKNGVPNYLQPKKLAKSTTKTKVDDETTTSSTSKDDTATKPQTELAPAVTTVTDEGSVDIYRPENQVTAMTPDEEKRVNKGVPSPAPIEPPAPIAVPEVNTTTEITPNATTANTTSITGTGLAALDSVKTAATNNDNSAATVTTQESSEQTTVTATDTTNKLKEANTTTVNKTTKPLVDSAKEMESKETKEKLVDAQTEEKNDTNRPKSVEPQDPEGKDQNKMVVYQNGESTSNHIGPARLNFPANSTKPALSGETADYFDTVAAYLKKHKRATIKITGHTDNRGDADLNRELGLKRAEIVRSALIRRGAPEKQLQVTSMGESKPIASNNTQEGRQQNRRVEIMPLK